MTATQALTAAGEAAAIALPVPDDDDDLLDDDEDEDEGPDDPAAQASAWREDAASIRAQRARVLGEAQARIDAVAAEASAEADRLEAEALAADKTAELWQADADLAARIVSAEAEVISLTARRDALAAEDARLTAESERLSVRLEEFGAARAQAKQRLLMAPRVDDVDGSIAAAKDAMADLAAIAEAERLPQQQRTAADTRLAEIRGPRDGMSEIRGPGGELVRGPAGEAPVTTAALARATGRLIDLRREQRGLPPMQERQEILVALVFAIGAGLASGDPDELVDRAAASVPEPLREAVRAEFGKLGEAAGDAGKGKAAAMLSAIASMPRLAEWLDNAAAGAPEQYQALRKALLGRSAPAPEVMPTVAEELAEPGFTLLGDGSVRYEPGYTGWGRSARTAPAGLLSGGGDPRGR